MARKDFAPMDKVEETFERALAQSPADETEIVWFERRHGLVSRDDGDEDGFGLFGRDPGGYVDVAADAREHVEDPRLTILVRVVEGGRVGWHRGELADADLISQGIRQALAVAKVQPKSKHTPLLPTQSPDPELRIPLYDEEIAGLDIVDARKRLASWCGEGEKARFHWSETHVAIFNSHGLRRTIATTEASLTTATAGVGSATDGQGIGFASSSARTIEALEPEKVIGRARQRAVGSEEASGNASLGTLSGDSVPVVLAGEAVIELLNVLNTFAFAGRAFLEGDSFLAKHRNIQVFDRAFHLRDDGSRTPGLPFPFDLEGALKKPVDLIVEGKPSTPALSRAQGDQAGLQSTAQSVGGQDALFGNLYLLAGGSSEADALAAADGGLWIGWLETPECFGPQRLEIRSRARGVRRIRDGQLAEPLPDLVWETSLLATLARLRGIASQPVVRAMPSTPFGGISAPALVLEQADGFGVAPARK